jgi:hypothetical protein
MSRIGFRKDGAVSTSCNNENPLGVRTNNGVSNLRHRLRSIIPVCEVISAKRKVFATFKSDSGSRSSYVLNQQLESYD